MTTAGLGRPPVGAPWITVVNVPNAVTLARTAAAVCLATTAITTRSTALLVAAYLTYWAGDILDGLLARRLRQETRAGAVFDILADRACTCVCAAGLLMTRPGMVLPITVFLLQFMVLDNLLSLAFLRWPLLSPNYFDRVSPGIHRWNWSPPAKALNTGALVVLITVSTAPLAPTLLAAAVTAVKLASLVALLRLPDPHAPAAP
ncbi:CDP-alcohol phosphatidyltransferase family protein [Actinacidiphila bryophytorum]|jgi:CDP-diacylglycerol--glycerol-3-phosphate 3-phosphatidyltransferase|uniref:CDP-alcohol phosphatidyltransferase family protein n=1 Tax=Actinacidiphila bryophytorum TaxID=1436133 RepID=UPI002176A461|nr:CDP-alcohol phosphatidyltransferase family protein [Actinacidiphila bryophytorum]UWE09313.1 CDP-alcohol phosphatidyltransferase family protein [Actinacidiphila bryophytorum]